jgi:Flp pilus assembly protein TadB
MKPELLLFAVIFLAAFPLIYRYLQTQQDPQWEERWKQLPQLQRQRIATAVQRGEVLQDPGEAELAAGYARQQRATATIFSSGRVAHLALASFFLLIGIVGGSPLVLVFALFLLSFFTWVAYRERVTKRNLDRAEDAAARR